jgi:hypothetical protein
MNVTMDDDVSDPIPLGIRLDTKVSKARRLMVLCRRPSPYLIRRFSSFSSRKGPHAKLARRMNTQGGPNGSFRET